MAENTGIPDKAGVLANLEIVRREYYALLDQVPVDRWGYKEPAVSLFSVGSLLVHTGGTMKSGVQALQEFRQGKNYMALPHSQIEDLKLRLSQEEAYRATPESLREEFETSYQAMVAAIESIKPEQWQRGGEFFDEGFFTVEKLLTSRLAHIREHAATMRKLLETGGSPVRGE